MNDLEQLRRIHKRLTDQQFLAMSCVAAADELVDGLYLTGKGVDPYALMSRYKAARAELTAAALDRDVG